MKKNKYLNDISEIKDIMNRSSQFLSLSGLSGIFAGVYALLGALLVKYIIEIYNINYKKIFVESNIFIYIVCIAGLVLFFSIVTAYYFSLKKVGFKHEKIWNTTSRRMLINFSIPFFTGAILIVLLLKNQYYGLIMPMILIFYGLACLNASKYTFRDIRYLGIFEIVLGLIAIEFSGYGLLFWSIGFGVLHIVYGGIMYYKYEKK